MITTVNLVRLAEKVLADSTIKFDHPAKILARAVLSSDNPDRFVKPASPYVPLSPYRDRSKE